MVNSEKYCLGFKYFRLRIATHMVIYENDI